jgi:hypothetical protein
VLAVGIDPDGDVFGDYRSLDVPDTNMGSEGDSDSNSDVESDVDNMPRLEPS